MKFCIRDDDTCFYTEPEVLRSVFDGIWEDIPVTLACIPMVSSDTDAMVDPTESKPKPIEENEELRAMIAQLLDSDAIEVAQHGYHHDTPDGKPEFVTGDQLQKKVHLGRQQLETAFNTDVQLFVPPHVRLSNRGVRAVHTNGLNIVRGYGPRPREIQADPIWVVSYARFLLFHIRYRRTYRYPYPIDYGTHREMYSHRLNNRTDMEWCKQAFDYIERNDGVFCLSVHANGLSECGTQKLHEMVAYARERNAEFVTASEAIYSI
jgi:hypothetical protein